MERASTNSQSRKARRTAEEIKVIIAQYENSGLSARDFCKQHQLKGFYLTRWLKRYGQNKPAKGFVVVHASKERVDYKELLFAEYRGIRFYQPVDPSYLKTLVN